MVGDLSMNRVECEETVTGEDSPGQLCSSWQNITCRKNCVYLLTLSDAKTPLSLVLVRVFVADLQHAWSTKGGSHIVCITGNVLREFVGMRS